MDAQMASTVSATNVYPTWDFVVVNGSVPYIVGDAEEQQKAELACFIQLGLIPSLPYAGVDWVSFFTGDISFGDLDAMIQQMINWSGVVNYAPTYSAAGNQLVVTLQRRQ